jgi:hypothetical protein
MRIWAFDPGSVATGVARTHQRSAFWDAFQVADELDVKEYFWLYEHDQDDVFLIEMYRSGGYLNKHAQRTIEVIGGLKMLIRSHTGIDPVMVTEQARLSGQREAAALIGDDIDVLRTDPERKDAFSALSHACAYRRRING